MTGFDLVIYTLKFMIPAVFTFLYRIFGLGFTTRRRLLYGLVVFTLYMTMVPSVLILIMGYGQFTHIVSLVMTIGAMSALIFSSDPVGKSVLLILIAGQMNTVVSVPLNMIRHIFKLSYFELDVLLLLVSSVVYLIALRFWVKPLRFIADNVHGGLTAPMLIPIVTTLLIYAVPVYPARNFEYHPVFCTFLMLGVELVFFLYIYTLYQSLLKISILNEHKLDAELLRLSTVSMVARLQLMDEAAHQSSLAAHDRRHFNSMVLELLEQGQTGEAAAFLRRQSGTLPFQGKKCCENTAVNAAVSYYAALAEGKGIATDIRLDIPSELTIDSLELAMALSNLLENAIHGCEALLQKEDRDMRFTCCHVGRLAIEITNTCAGDIILDKNGYPIPRKTGHGLGTKSVRAFAAKYDAELFYGIENGVFTVRLLV